MEEQISQPAPNPIPPQQEPISPPPARSRAGLFLGGVILLLVFLAVAFSAYKFSSQNSNSSSSPTPTQQASNIAAYTLVYGAWTSNSSVINAYDLSSGKEYSLATLPSNIKKVSVIDNNNLLYISDTDNQDHGRSIEMYNITNKKSSIVLKAAEGFGIDDYVISPNKKYIALWEVQNNPQANVLFGGRSRVYTAEISNPSSTHLIYDEGAIAPVHYPRGILDNGTVYSDTFLANSGAGWAYGMSVSDFTGSNKQDLANMQNGSYGSQPDLSPDGKYFVFAGYDGKDGDGVEDVNGFRRAVLSPDTIAILDTSSNQVSVLSNLPNIDSYPEAKWDTTGQNIIYRKIDSKTKALETYTYNIAGHTSEKIATDGKSDVITNFSGSTYLVGEAASGISAVGNLGEGYSKIISQPSVLNTTTSKTTPLSLQNSLIQYVDIKPAAYFASTASLVTNQTDSTNNQLHLQEASLKPTLAPVRQFQQSTYVAPAPKTGGSIAPEENNTPAQKGTMTKPCNPPNVTGGSGTPCPTSTPVISCANQNSAPQCANLPKCSELWAERGTHEGITEGVDCYDSPLYLYGEKGTKVHVKIWTSVFGASPVYNPADGYDITLGENGNMLIHNSIFSKISYNYTPAVRKVAPPTSGSIVSKKELSATLSTYAHNLGLNKKETGDLINESLPLISSPFVFVSFFNHDTSQAILPLSFSPQPDVYRNIVFYFKQLNKKPSYSVAAPTFEKIKRHGLTAVEISEMVE